MLDISYNQTKAKQKIMPSLLLNSILKRSKDSIKESLINESLSCKRIFKKSNLIYYKKSKKLEFSFINSKLIYKSVLNKFISSITRTL